METKHLRKEIPFSKRWFKSYSYITIGTLLVSMGYVLFLSPHKIIPGGIYGISIMLHHLFNTPIGMVSLAFNIPLTLIGTKILGPRFGAKTVVAFVLTGVFTDIISMISGNVALVPDDTLVSGLFGGLFVGVGVAFTFKAKATSGGTDVVAMILQKYTRLPIGQLMMSVDAVIVFISTIVFKDWTLPLYSFISIFVIGRVIDAVMHGFSYDKTLFIISDKHQEIRDSIIGDLGRGGTFLIGEGMYKYKSKKIIFTVVNPKELYMLQEYIHRIDPNAFIAVLDANEILGKGFKNLEDKLDEK